ncbi:outer membrane beta-barrel protein [Gemmatimonas sp.]|uniref:outer membrane protein n=1 Tax=Gemmatimonas sp. TaxID=1962908 RepID=UPI0025BD6BBC|nr:outer membrane beta-barrel protein [Gemmatimonas sp.]MCA2985730.1 outer membrane beta-barrel protein [Gemmatimonas sp.]MCA2987257.1 outer membrane beta-barrel protein [Gemmatimonas sp.]
MKHALRTCALIAAVMGPATLGAQSTDRSVSVGVSGGLSLPMGDLGDVANSGYNLTGHLFFKPAALQSVRLRADVSVDQWDYKDVVVYKGSTRAIGFVGNVLYDIPTESSSMLRPYVLGGLGIFNTRNPETDQSDTNLGLQVGGGLTFQLSGFSTFAEARFVNVFSDGRSSRYVPITFGVRF